MSIRLEHCDYGGQNMTVQSYDLLSSCFYLQAFGHFPKHSFLSGCSLPLSLLAGLKRELIEVITASPSVCQPLCAVEAAFSIEFDLMNLIV